MYKINKNHSKKLVLLLVSSLVFLPNKAYAYDYDAYYEEDFTIQNNENFKIIFTKKQLKELLESGGDLKIIIDDEVYYITNEDLLKLIEVADNHKKDENNTMIITYLSSGIVVTIVYGYFYFDKVRNKKRGLII